jgi:tellurite methyltransferase
MRRDRIKWNDKYRKQGYPTEPSGLVKEFFSMAPGRTALDIAAGSGRNALFLAEQGFAVDAVDIAEEGLALFSGRHPGVRSICADLDTFDIPTGRYDLILNTLYLNRRLFPQIREGLRPGGLLIFETLLEMPGDEGHGEHCRDYFLRPNELLSGIAGPALPRGVRHRPGRAPAPGLAGGGAPGIGLSCTCLWPEQKLPG